MSNFKEEKEEDFFFLKLQDRIEHAQRFDETFLPRAPLAQLLESDKAVLVHIDFLSTRRRRRRRRQLTSDPTRITRARTSFHHQIALQPTTRRCVYVLIYIDRRQVTPAAFLSEYAHSNFCSLIQIVPNKFMRVQVISAR